MELFIWVLELIFVFVMLIMGYLRKRGLWFIFGAIVGLYSIIQLALVDNFVLTNNLGYTPSCAFDNVTQSLMCSTPPSVTLDTSAIFIPLLLVLANLASIIALRKALGRGAV